MLRRFPHALIAVAALASCNAITGIDDVVFTSRNTGPAMPAVVYLPADGVSITQIAVYQGPKRSFLGGDPSPAGIIIPVVAGRDALVRVYVEVDDAYDGSDVYAHLYLGTASPIEVKGPVVASVEDDLATTINFEVPGAMLEPGIDYHVELKQTSEHTKGQNARARHPAEGAESLDVQSSGAAFKLMMLPISYGADGSNRLPDMSEEQMLGYMNAFHVTYPAATVEFVMHDPMQWNMPILPNGAGWSEILDAVTLFRQKEGTPNDVFLFGFFSPAVSFNQYCQGGCVAGLGSIGSVNDPYSKAAVGLGFGGYNSWSTAIHEVGHTLGRHHSPCGGAGNVDPMFPYPSAGIGVPGFDLVEKKLIAADAAKDMMGYCDPYFISDYTYKGIFEQLSLVNKADIYVPDELRDRTWERVRIQMDGTLVWIDPVRMKLPPRGEALPVTVLHKAGTKVADGQFFPYDHLPGGVILWPRDAGPIAGIQVTVDGVVKSLAR